MTATIDHTEEIPEVPHVSATPPDAPARRVQYRRDPSPWRRRDMVVCGLLALVGIAGVVACWIGASDEAFWRDQTGWLTGAILSTGLVIVGGGLWVLIGLRRVRQGFRDLRRDQRTVLGLTRVRGAGQAVATAPSGTGDLVAAKDQTRVHRPECLLLRGKQAVAVGAADLEKYSRCGVCDS